MQFRARFNLWRTIIFLPTWRWFVVVPFGVLSSGTWARDEFLDQDQQEKFRIPKVVSDWSWEPWALVGLIVTLLIVLESAFRYARTLQPTIDRRGLRNTLSEFSLELGKLNTRITLDEEATEDECLAGFHNWDSRVQAFIREQTPDLLGIYLAQNQVFTVMGGWRANLPNRINVRSEALAKVIDALND